MYLVACAMNTERIFDVDYSVPTTLFSIWVFHLCCSSQYVYRVFESDSEVL